MKGNLSHQIKELWKLGLRYVNLQIDYAKLTALEKATILLSGIVLTLIGIFVFGFMLFFVAIAVADFFKEVMEPPYAHLCVAGIYLILFIFIYIFKKPLIVNPISRYISKIVFSKEVDNTQNESK